MTAATPGTLAQLQDEAQQLNAEITASGVNVTDHSTIIATAKKLLALLDKLQPHLNKAQSAFGGNETSISAANDLRNKLNKVIAVYGSA